MIDVGGKQVSKRERENKIPKGNVIENARTAAIFAIKKVPDLIPLCHPVKITWADVEFNLKEESVEVEVKVRGIDRTGVEMEAITAVAIAALTIYDMCKTVDKNIVIESVKLVEKRKEEIV